MPRTAARKHTSHSFGESVQDQPLSALVRLWILRLLVPLQGHRKFIGKHYLQEDSLAHALGLGAWVDVDEEDFDPKAVLKVLRAQYQDAERSSQMMGLGEEPLRRNLERLAPLIGLNSAEQGILAFTALQANESLLNDALELLDEKLSPNRLCRILAFLLEQKEADIQMALSPRGRLVRSGLLSVTGSVGSWRLSRSFSFLSDRFADALVSRESGPVELLESVVSAPAAAELKLEDYAHVRPWLDILIPYLRQSVDSKRQGVNVLLYGRPGTGKTQLSRLLAQTLDAALFDVCIEDEEGDAIGGDQRLRAYRTAQCVFACSPRTLLAFDEAEDVFAGAGRFLAGGRSKTEISKAWVNRLLEENPVPTIWISNAVSCIDPAYLRRFDLVIEIPVPSRCQRMQLIESVAGDLLLPQARERLASIEHLPPALLTRATEVVQTGRTDPAWAVQSVDPGEVIERLIGGTLKACGQADLLRQPAGGLPDTYDPALSCADADLSSLTEGLIRAGSARLCLYGPPGTGKTAWAHWLSRSLDKPLLVRRVSDLLSKWVGESEQLIAGAFEAAARDDAVLLIDEVDSFLMDRRNARQSWETTLVNEMLTQMESFGGIFIASTNLMGTLDPAALRRFDVKVQFHYLKPEQARSLYRRYSAVLGLPDPKESVMKKLDELHALAPGDFAVVARQHRFRPLKHHAEMLEALRAEEVLKPNAGGRGIGFV